MKYFIAYFFHGFFKLPAIFIAQVLTQRISNTFVYLQWLQLTYSFLQPTVTVTKLHVRTIRPTTTSSICLTSGEYRLHRKSTETRAPPVKLSRPALASSGSPWGSIPKVWRDLDRTASTIPTCIVTLPTILRRDSVISRFTGGTNGFLARSSFDVVDFTKCYLFLVFLLFISCTFKYYVLNSGLDGLYGFDISLFNSKQLMFFGIMLIYIKKVNCIFLPVFIHTLQQKSINLLFLLYKTSSSWYIILWA